MRRVAVIGSGIAGLAAARSLSRGARVTLFESADGFGGHRHTVDVTVGGISHGVDTGFLVFNDRTCPRLVRLLAELGVAWPGNTRFAHLGVLPRLLRGGVRHRQYQRRPVHAAARTRRAATAQRSQPLRRK